MRVLIVDDSEVLVQRLRFSLGEVAGIEIVGQADNAAEAAREIHQSKPDAVILDIRMPGGSGIEVLEGLKKDPFPPIVIVLSNYSDRQYRRKCLASGARFFFDKSAEFHKVAEVLRSLVEAAV
jgi:DNA-binding NarL/FixJ family response regulator